MASSIEQLQYHLVWCVKYRYKLLSPEIAGILKSYFEFRQKKWNYKIISIAIEPDHIHFLLEVPNSEINLNSLVRKLKGGSSLVIRKQFPKLRVYPNLWTHSHFLQSVGSVSEQTIKEYIEKQGITEQEIVKRTFIYKVWKPNKKKKNQLEKWLSNFSCRPKGLQSGYQKKFLNQICLRNDLIKIEKKKDRYWLQLPGGNSWKQIWLGLSGRELPENVKIKDSKIIKRKNDFYVYLNIEEERTIENKLRNSTSSIDLGISHPITNIILENDRMKDYKFYGSEVKREQYKRMLRYAKSKNETTAIKNTQRIKDSIHKYTREIIQKAKENNAILVVGNLHNITKTWDKKQRSRNKTFRKKAKPMPYGKIMSQLWYKATLQNLQVAFQDEAYTSQRCSRCGVVGKRNGEHFHCEQCNYQNQADVNGAVNIAKAFQLTHYGLGLVPASAGNSLL